MSKTHPSLTAVPILVLLLLTGCASTSARPDPTVTTAPTTTLAVTTSTVPDPTTTTTITATTTSEPHETHPVTFIAAGDVGGHEDPAGPVLRAMAKPESDFFLFLGDLSYGEIEPAAAWCTWVKGFFPAGYPIEVVAGNHEEDESVDGFIRDFTPCLPDRMGAVGDYGVEYYFDSGPVRVIMVGADVSVDGTAYDYDTPGPRRDWLLERVDEAEARGLWTVVGMHKVCVTTGVKDCEVGEPTIDDLIDHGADLILHGHEHNYQRSHQLGCIDHDTTTAACIVDTDSDHHAEDGAVIAIAGWVGGTAYEVSRQDNEAGYFAVIGGPTDPGWGPGFLTITATDTTLTGVWTTAGGGKSDSFTIERTG